MTLVSRLWSLPCFGYLLRMYFKILLYFHKKLNIDKKYKIVSKTLDYKPIIPDNEIDKMIYTYNTFEYRKGYIEIGEEKFVMPSRYIAVADEIENFEVRDTDIWVISRPKSGTTWTQEMVRLILNNVDYEDAKELLQERFIDIEADGLYDFPFMQFYLNLFNYSFVKKYCPPNLVPMMKRGYTFRRTPRMFKTHLPWQLLPKMLRNRSTKAKIIYVIRNPKDVCASRYYFQLMVSKFSGSFEDYCRILLAGRDIYGPHWPSLKAFWERRNDPLICVIKYEDMKKDLGSVVRKVSQFLINKQLSEEKFSSLLNHLSFEKMKDNLFANNEAAACLAKSLLNTKGKFMRYGQVGSYKKDMHPEMERLFDRWIEKNIQGTDITF